jgi:hypothetical protein
MVDLNINYYGSPLYHSFLPGNEMYADRFDGWNTKKITTYTWNDTVREVGYPPVTYQRFPTGTWAKETIRFSRTSTDGEYVEHKFESSIDGVYWSKTVDEATGIVTKWKNSSIFDSDDLFIPGSTEFLGADAVAFGNLGIQSGAFGGSSTVYSNEHDTETVTYNNWLGEFILSTTYSDHFTLDEFVAKCRAIIDSITFTDTGSVSIETNDGVVNFGLVPPVQHSPYSRYCYLDINGAGSITRAGWRNLGIVADVVHQYWSATMGQPQDFYNQLNELSGVSNTVGYYENQHLACLVTWIGFGQGICRMRKAFLYSRTPTTTGPLITYPLTKNQFPPKFSDDDICDRAVVDDNYQVPAGGITIDVPASLSTIYIDCGTIPLPCENQPPESY